jgi:predicted metal-binding membrane protein
MRIGQDGGSVVRADDVNLGGLTLALALFFPGPTPYDGNATARLYVEEGAITAQRSALKPIMQGQRGGPMQIPAGLITTWLPTQTAPITVQEANGSIQATVGTVGQIHSRRLARLGPLVPTTVFVPSYLLVWGGYSVVAPLAQWGLHSAALLSPMIVVTSPIVGGLLLMAAGSFQWTPLKSTCLRQCRSPLGFVMTEWREGTWGALVMGLRHGSYCVGCCWVLMALLFVAGVMNLLWVAVIAALVLVEKVLPRGELVGRVAGGVLVLAGLALLGQRWLT